MVEGEKLIQSVGDTAPYNQSRQPPLCKGRCQSQIDGGVVAYQTCRRYLNIPQEQFILTRNGEGKPPPYIIMRDAEGVVPYRDCA